MSCPVLDQGRTPRGIQLGCGLSQDRCERFLPKGRQFAVISGLAQELLAKFPDSGRTVIVEFEKWPQYELGFHTAWPDSYGAVPGVNVEFDQLLDQGVINLDSFDPPS